MKKLFESFLLLLFGIIPLFLHESAYLCGSDGVPAENKPGQTVLWSANDAPESFDSQKITFADVKCHWEGTQSARKLVAIPDQNYAWPGINFHGPWNLNSVGKILVEVENLDPKQTLVFHCRLDDDQTQKTQRWLSSQGKAVAPGKKGWVEVEIPSEVPGYIAEKVYGMRGVPGNLPTDVHTGKVNMSALKKFNVKSATVIRVFINKSNTPTRFALTRVIADHSNKARYSWAKNTESEFFPMIDEFGQFVHEEWPGKIHQEKDLQARMVQEEADLAAHAAPGDWNEYGGWKSGPQLKATGHFRTELYQGKWWLVDPLGRLFWSHGVDCVGWNQGVTAISDREHLFAGLPSAESPLNTFYGTSSYAAHGFYHEKVKFKTFNFTAANLFRKYGKDWEDKFISVTHRRLRSWGMNTIGNWSNSNIYGKRQTPYTLTCGTWCSVIEGSQGFWGKFPDPFHPDFRTSLQKTLAKQKEFLNDPWCIGIFVNNELSWGADRSLAEASLVSPATQPAKIALIQWLRNKYQTIEALNNVWKTKYLAWDDLKEVKTLPEGEGKQGDMAAFHYEIATQYFTIIHDELRKEAPNKLDLGCRFAWCNDPAIVAASKIVDVVSFNKYAYSVKDFKLPKDATDKPCIIGEFHFGALDRGMLHCGLRPTANQEDRALKYKEYLQGALANRNWVGTHWFQYGNQATTGRFDGENYQIGLVDLCDTPYPETIKAVRTIGYEMYRLRSGK